jgi:hypothetical protein
MVFSFVSLAFDACPVHVRSVSGSCRGLPVKTQLV